MVQRVTYTRRKSFNTKSNKVRMINTPGGRLAIQYVGKRAAKPTCGEPGCDQKLFGIKALRPKEYARVSKTQKHVTRAYGGAKCAACVRNRIMRAFLIEEQKIVKKFLQTQTAAPKKD